MAEVAVKLKPLHSEPMYSAAVLYTATYMQAWRKAVEQFRLNSILFLFFPSRFPPGSSLILLPLRIIIKGEKHKERFSPPNLSVHINFTLGGLGNSKFAQEIAIAVQHKMYLSNYTQFFFLFGKLTSVKWGFINGIWLGENKKTNAPFNACSWLWEKWLWIPLQKALSSSLGNRTAQSRLHGKHFFLRSFFYS